MFDEKLRLSQIELNRTCEESASIEWRPKELRAAIFRSCQPTSMSVSVRRVPCSESGIAEPKIGSCLTQLG